MTTYSSEETVHELEELNELRFEVEASGTATLELVEGEAEIFGTELIHNRVYTFLAGSKSAVFTYAGCVIKLVGHFEVSYVAKQTPMVTYMNVHAALEQLRGQASEHGSRGPRVMITGPTDVGKSTICRILINYAVRAERIPIFVDLDVGQGEISIPGSLGGLIIQRPHDIEDGYPQSIPLIYHYGHKSAADNLLLYNELVSTLSQTINARCESNSNANVSGCIINTCGWIKGGGYKSLVHIAGAFEVDIIIVVDQERLYTELRRDMPDFVKIIQLQKSGGVVERNREARINARDGKIRNYFYGKNGELSPHCFYVNFSEVKIFQIGAPELPDSLLPLGMVMQQKQTKLMPMVPSEALKHHVLSLCACDTDDSEENIVNTPVLGFIVITEVDMERSRFMILSPAPSPLPKAVLLDTDITFMDIK